MPELGARPERLPHLGLHPVGHDCRGAGRCGRQRGDGHRDGSDRWPDLPVPDREHHPGGAGPLSGFSALALPPFRTLDAFTDRQFRDFAGRAPTSAELSTWRTQLTNGTVTPVRAVENANAFRNWAPTQSPVIRLFRAYFLRTPTSVG